MQTAALWRRVTSDKRRAVFLRYLLALGIVASVILIVPRTPLQGPVGSVLTIVTALLCAWFGGLGPAVLIGPMLLLISRVVQGKSWILTGQEVLAVSIIMSVTMAVGLAGQYRRRIQTVSKQHAQRLRDHARALSLAQIVYRDVTGRITEWNEGIARLYGWSAQEALGRSLNELLMTRFPQPLDVIERELLERGQWKGEVRQCHKSGRELTVSAHWIVYWDESGSPIGVAELYNDVTDLRRAEEEIRQANRRKDEFLASLGHELRNPLAPIRAGIDYLKLARGCQEQVEEIQGILDRQVRQLVAIVDDLLDVSRITRGRLKLRKVAVRIGDIIQSAVEATASRLEEAGHELIVNLPDEPVSLQADPNRLTQVLSNLLNNAAKFTPSGGRIELSARRHGGTVEIRVADNGIGVPPEMAEQIFEMFTQANRELVNGDCGLGIGLALAKSLVELHGGRIDLQSEGAQRGTEFTIQLPCLNARRADMDDSPLSVNAPAGGGRRILIVDDNAAAVKLLGMMIKSLGHEVRTASDGVCALEAAEEFRPELVLMDLGMPRMNGFEAARQVRKQIWGRDMKLVALSGWGQDEDRRRALDAGFDDHLTKPATAADVQRLISGLRSRPRARHALPALPVAGE